MDHKVIKPDHLEMADGYAHFRARGHMTLQKAVGQVTAVIAYCRQNKIHKLLADVTALTGFKPPEIEDRLWFAEQWSSAASGVVTVAMVATAEYIDPQKIGVIAMKNRGMTCDVFITEAEAMHWLTGKKMPHSAKATPPLKGRKS